MLNRQIQIDLLFERSYYVISEKILYEILQLNEK